MPASSYRFGVKSYVAAVCDMPQQDELTITQSVSGLDKIVRKRRRNVTSKCQVGVQISKVDQLLFFVLVACLQQDAFKDFFSLSSSRLLVRKETVIPRRSSAVQPRIDFQYCRLNNCLDFLRFIAGEYAV